MVIHDKALLSAVKEAYNHGGYTVCYRQSGHYVIYSHYWGVEIQDDNIPRKLLGLLSEHMGFLPEQREAYKITKSKDGPQVQNMIWEPAIEPFVNLEDKWAVSRVANPVKIQKTVLTYEGCNVWQKTGNLGIVLIDPNYERIFQLRENTYLVGNCLYQEGAISKAYVLQMACKEDSPYMVQLSGIQWTAR